MKSKLSKEELLKCIERIDHLIDYYNNRLCCEDEVSELELRKISAERLLEEEAKR